MVCPEKFAPFPTRDAFRPLVAFHAKVRILEIIRILLTDLSQLRCEGISLGTVLTPIYVLLGYEVRELINLRYWNLVER